MSVKGHIRNFVKKPSQIFEFTITWNGIVLLIRIFLKKEEGIFSSPGSQKRRPISDRLAHMRHFLFILVLTLPD